MRKISVVMAALNEERTIGKVIENVKESLKGRDFEVIVVDNGSYDRTPEIAKNSGAIVVRENKRGKGKAVIKGISKAKGEIIVFIDADASYPATSIPDLIRPIEEEDVDVVFGSRFLRRKPFMNPLRLYGNRLLTFIASLIFSKTTDLLTGMIAVKRKMLLPISLKSSGFEIETEFFIKCVRMNLKRKEIPIDYTGRKHSKLNPLLDGIKILFLMIRSLVE